MKLCNTTGAARRTAHIVSLSAFAAALAACAHHAPATIRDNTTIISGRSTAHQSAADATRTVLIEAAAITVDHGYRYFCLETPVRPGADVTIHVYGKGEIDERTPNVYDADAIGAGQMPAPALAGNKP